MTSELHHRVELLEYKVEKLLKMLEITLHGTDDLTTAAKPAIVSERVREAVAMRCG
jgi:hypothetical protein